MQAEELLLFFFLVDPDRIVPNTSCTAQLITVVVPLVEVEARLE